MVFLRGAGIGENSRHLGLFGRRTRQGLPNGRRSAYVHKWVGIPPIPGSTLKIRFSRQHGSHRRTLPGIALGLASIAMASIGLALGTCRPAIAQTLPPPMHHVNIALYEGENPPIALLQAFDALILDPASSFDPSTHPLAHTAYVAHIGATSDASVDAFVAQEFEPLWQRGYRGVLLDTPAGYAAIDAIHTAHPDAKIVV